MSEKIKNHAVGDCVEVTTWDHGRGDFFTPGTSIGLVLEAELMEMDGEEVGDMEEWLYRVVLSSGKVVEAWDYEIKHVNAA